MRTPRPVDSGLRRTFTVLLALFALSFSVSVQAGHRPSAAPLARAGAWVVICTPAGLQRARADDPAHPASDGTPYCPICLALHAGGTPLPVAVAELSPPERAAFSADERPAAAGIISAIGFARPHPTGPPAFLI